MGNDYKAYSHLVKSKATGQDLSDITSTGILFQCAVPCTDMKYFRDILYAYDKNITGVILELEDPFRCC